MNDLHNLPIFVMARFGRRYGKPRIRRKPLRGYIELPAVCLLQGEPDPYELATMRGVRERRFAMVGGSK